MAPGWDPPGQSPQGPWPWLTAWWVSAIADPPIAKIQIVAMGAHPVIAGAMAPVAVVTPTPVHMPTMQALPITLLHSLRELAFATRLRAMVGRAIVEVATSLTRPCKPAPPCGGGRAIN